MILIVIKIPIRPDKADEWLKLATWYAEQVRSEDGNEFFEFSRSIDNPDEYVCVEGFRDDAAGQQHMSQSYVGQFVDKAADCVSARPQIIYVDAEEVTGFVEMGEISPRG